MRHSTRLDTVVKLRERDEERTRRELGAAHACERRAKEAALLARSAALVDGRGPGDAFDWQLAEAANARALGELKVAQERTCTATKAVDVARERHSAARGHAEAMRRAAEARRAELVQEERRLDRRDTDEVAVLLHWRAAV